MLGTRGVPAQYGGFETAVEEIGARLVARGHQVTVYARNPGQSLTEYRGMRVVNLPAVRHRFTETLSHAALSGVHAVLRDRPDVAVVLNSGNAPVARSLVMAGIPVAVHMDGLESRREKWRGAGARYYNWAERKAVKWADLVIADSQVIEGIIEAESGREVEFIPYGAQVIDPGTDRLSELGVVRRDYHLVVARFEPENHVLDAVHAYRANEETRPLLVVGGSPYSRWYVDKVEQAADEDRRIRLVGGIYDQELLDQLYANCRTYIHGHSVGGTNPSLLRAMGAGAPVLAFECPFNREVLADRGLFWSSAQELTELLDQVAHSGDDLLGGDIEVQLEQNAAAGRERVRLAYSWDAVADDYERVLVSVLQDRKLRTR